MSQLCRNMNQSLLLFYSIYIVLLLTGGLVVEAVVDLEQSGVLYVCHGGAMSVTCRTSTDLLRWNITLHHPSPQRMFERILSNFGTIRMEQPIITNLTTLSISRSLDSSSPLPLASTISTNNVTTDLNGTVITCSGMSMMMGLLASENVEVIVTNIRSRINNVAIPSISEQFRPEDISVTLEWTGTNGVSYSIRVDREVAVNYTGRNSAQFIVSYDTRYNISVVAALCGITMTSFAIIHHVTCPPLDSDNSPSADRVPALVRSATTFSCPPGTVLTGSNVTTCTANRQWYPDQNNACKVDCTVPMVKNNITLKYNSTLEDSLLTFQCDDGLLPENLFTARCYNNGSWIPNPSNHICSNSSAANCGDPSPPSDGYIEPYTSTVEGAIVKVVHVRQDGHAVEEIVCSQGGHWEIVNSSACTSNPGNDMDAKSTVSLLVLSSSVGSLLAIILALLAYGIAITIIAVSISRKKAITHDGQIESKHSEYEEVVTTRNDKPEELEMVQNLAYGPLQPR